MDYNTFLFAALFAALVFIPFSSSILSSLDSCPDHCYCFVVSRNVPPPTALLSSYIHANDWVDGSKAIACWGRKDIPQPISSDVKYLVLIGSQKPKRRREKEARRGLRARSLRGSLTLRRSRTFIIPDPTPVRRRNIRSIPQDAFTGLREIIHIDLHGNKIVDIPPATFQGLSDLQVLNLNENRIKSLHNDILHEVHGLRTFLVAGNFLRSVPEDIFLNNPGIERLDMSDNLLWSIPGDCFQSLSTLKFLNLSYNRVNEKNPMIFTGLLQLKELQLQRNKFTRIDPALFLSNTQLKTVDLSLNRIKNIAPNSFQNQQLLESLDLSGNFLGSLHSLALYGAASLRALDLSSNDIDEIMYGAFTHLVNLTKLYMKENKLQNITENTFGDIPKLSYLSLARNSISHIAPNAMVGLERLKNLDLSGNKLRHLQARALYGLVALMELNLADNQLFILEPKALKTTALPFMSQLTWLNLQGNQLVELQRDVFRGAPSLRVLTLSKNKITRIVPHAFNGFNRLQRLMLSDNHLERLPAGTFQLLRTLEMLDLRNNSIAVISDRAFQGLNALSNLYLAQNRLIDPKMGWLKHIQSIQTLSLMDNRLPEISSEDFEVAQNLRYLYLSNNNLTKVSVRNDSRLYLFNLTLSNNQLTELQDFSAHILSGRALALAGNPWNCTCRLVQSFIDMKRRYGIIFDKDYHTRCHTPDSLRGIKISDLVRSGVSCRGEHLVDVTAIADTTTSNPTTTNNPSPLTYQDWDLDRMRWSWSVLIWDSSLDGPICNGALVSSSFVLTSYKCLTRIAKIHSFLQLVSGCQQPLSGKCQDMTWTAPSNLEVKVSAGQGKLSEFLQVAETYRVLKIHRVPPVVAPDWSDSVLLQVSPSIDLQGPASVIDILAETPTFGTLDGKRVLASGWWIDYSKAPEIVGRQKRRHYRVTSSQCGLPNDVHQPYLCGHLEQDLEDYEGWDSLGAPVAIREQNQWKLIGILMRNENGMGFIKDVRQDRDRIKEIITLKSPLDHVTHPY